MRRQSVKHVASKAATLQTPNTPDTPDTPNSLNSVRSNSVSRSRRIRSVSKDISSDKMSDDDKKRLGDLISKLFTLLLTNLTITICSLIFLTINLSYTAGSLDMMASNICLWMVFGFNDKYYTKYCKLCIYLCGCCNTKSS